MKILKRGKRPEDKVYRAECNNCGTEVEFKYTEAKHTFDQRDGDFLTVKCPVCKQPIHTGV
jgi:endogenous inhibitor of DNA gyrase (YacG/DUF329 family)